MSQGFNIRDVISKGAADIPLESLAKQGFKRVKVLDKDTINRLIEEAVVRVVEDRLQEASARERAQIQAESKREFTKLVADRQQEESKHLTDYQDRVKSLELETARLREELAEREADILRFQQEAVGSLQAGANQSSDDFKALKESIDMLARKVGSGGVAGGVDMDATDDRAIKALVDRAGRSSLDLESNVKKVQVKKAQAGGVNKNLAKLKALQKGGGEE